MRRRKAENMGFPARWCWRHGAIYYQVPPDQKHHWDGKALFRLGKTPGEAYAEWAKRIKSPVEVHTIGALLDRYALEIIPGLKPVTARRYKQLIPHLRGVFGEMEIGDLEPQHVYKYFDARRNKVNGKGGPVQARHEISLLSGVYSKAVQWGYLSRHPFKGQVELPGIAPRTRYIEDWEILECFTIEAPEMQAYIRLKLLTALRKTDLLKIRIVDLKEDGIHVGISKTGEPVIISWSPALKDAVDQLKALRPVDISPWLICNRRGKSYYSESSGLTTGFDNKWQRFMKTLLEKTKITQRFTEHDLRAKCASDVSLSRAQELLSHADSKTTKRFYRRKPRVITPAQ